MWFETPLRTRNLLSETFRNFRNVLQHPRNFPKRPGTFQTPGELTGGCQAGRWMGSHDTQGSSCGSGLNCHVAHMTCVNRWLNPPIWSLLSMPRGKVGFWSNGPREPDFDRTSNLIFDWKFLEASIKHVAEAWHMYHMSITDWFTPFKKPTQHATWQVRILIGQSTQTGFWLIGPHWFSVENFPKLLQTSPNFSNFISIMFQKKDSRMEYVSHYVI